MKAEVELCTALKDVLDNITYEALTKERAAVKVANLVAALEVFTDLNFTEEEQKELFNISAIRLKELQEKLK